MENALDIATAYLRKNKDFINIRAIARFIGYNHTSVNLWINGKADGHQTKVRLPDDCQDRLLELVEQMRSL